MIHVTRGESLVQSLSPAEININYTDIGELSKLNAQVSLFQRSGAITLLTTEKSRAYLLCNL